MRQNGFVCKIDLTLIWGRVQGGVVAGAGSAYTDKTDKEGFSRVMLRGVRSSRLLGILGPPLDNDLFGI
jgi:hypothetical protein